MELSLASVRSAVRRTGRSRRDIVRPSLPPAPPDAESLLEALAQQRNRASFVALFEHFGPRLKGLFLARRLQGAVAEDLTQEVMLRVWRSAGQYDRSRGAASTWIYTLARNCLVDHLRRQNRPEVDQDDPARVEEPASAEASLVSAESAAALRDALAALPPEQGEVIEDAYFAGRSLSEIADARALPLGTVKTRARLAMARLRAVFGVKRVV